MPSRWRIHAEAIKQKHDDVGCRFLIASGRLRGDRRFDQLYARLDAINTTDWELSFRPSDWPQVPLPAALGALLQRVF